MTCARGDDVGGEEGVEEDTLRPQHPGTPVRLFNDDDSSLSSHGHSRVKHEPSGGER